MKAEDCMLLRDESVDSGSLNRCIGNLFGYIGEIASRNDDETSENYPDSPFYKDGVGNALEDETSVYYKYGITDSADNDNVHGVVQRTYSGPLNVAAYRDAACRTESATGTYVYGNMNTVLENFLPTLDSLHSPTFPIVLSSLMDDEAAFEMANGTQTLSTTYFPVVKYTSYVLCSGIGVSFGTITFDSKNGASQGNRLRLDVRRDLVHLVNAGEIVFVSVSNGYASGIERISEDGDMLEDISPCTVTFLDRDHNDIYVGGVTKCDGGERIRIDSGTGRILSDDEDPGYGATVELDNSTYALSFFVVFRYRPPDVAFSNSEIGLGMGVNRTDYSRFMYGVTEIDGEKMTLDGFLMLDNYSDDGSKTQTNTARNVVEAFAGCSNATFAALSGISSRMQYMTGCFRNCTAATFEMLSGIDPSSLKSMDEAFYGCTNATFAGLANIDIPMSSAAKAFCNCNSATFSALTSLTLGGDASYMFYGCGKATFGSLASVGGSPSSTSHMFESLNSATFSALTSLTLGGDASYMFYGCGKATFGSSNTTAREFDDFGTGLVNGSHMFDGCSSANIKVKNPITTNGVKALASLSDAAGMFKDCASVEVESLNANGTLSNARDMFRNVAGSVKIDEFGDGTIVDANGMFRDAGSVSITGGDVFNVGDMGGMFMNVNGLFLDSPTINAGNDNANAATNAASAFMNVTSGVFKEYKNCAISNRLSNADAMFALDDRSSADNLFSDVAATSDTYAYAFTRCHEAGGEGKSENRSNAIVRSSITTARNMFFGRSVSRKDAMKLFKNPFGPLTVQNGDKYQYCLPVPSGIVNGDGMYSRFRITGTEDLTLSISVPETLESAADMFAVEPDGNCARFRMAPVFSYTQNDGNARYNAHGTVVFSDGVHSSHSDMFKGAKFDHNFRGDLTMSVKDVHTDFFAGSDFGFDGFSHFTDRSGKYWTDANGDFQFFSGRNDTPRTPAFEDMKDDFSKWFVEGVSLVNLFTPYPEGVDEDLYCLVTDVKNGVTGTRGVPRAAMRSDKDRDGILHTIAVGLRAYTQYVTFRSVEELHGQNMTCMFNPTLLVSSRDVMTYTKSLNPEYFADSQPASATAKLYVVGNTLGRSFASLAASATSAAALDEAFPTNVDYPVATFESLTAVCGVNMPFAFHGLQRASMSSLAEIRGDCANAVAAFSDMPCATFDSLTAVYIDNPFTSAVQSSTSFSNDPTHWNGYYYRMFEGDVFASFEKLGVFRIRSSTTVHLERMFFRTGIDHIPSSFEVESSGDVYMSRFMSRVTLPSGFPVQDVDGRLQMTCMSGYAPDVQGSGVRLIANKKSGSGEIRFAVPPGVSTCTIAMSGTLYNANTVQNAVTVMLDSNASKSVQGGTIKDVSVSTPGDRPCLVRITLKATNPVKSDIQVGSIKFVNAKSGESREFGKFFKNGNIVFAYSEDNTESNDGASENASVNHHDLRMTIRGSSIDASFAFGDCALSNGKVVMHATGSLFAQHGFDGLTLDDTTSQSTPSGLSFELTSEHGIIDASNLFRSVKFKSSNTDDELGTPHLTSIVVSSGTMSGGTTVKPYMSDMFRFAGKDALSKLSTLYVQPCPFSSSGQETYYASMFGTIEKNLDHVPVMTDLSETNIACLEFNRERSVARTLFDVDTATRSEFVSKRKLPVGVVYGMEWTLTDYEKFTDSVVQTDGLSAVQIDGKVDVGVQGAYVKTDLSKATPESIIGFAAADGVDGLLPSGAILDVNARPTESNSLNYTMNSGDVVMDCGELRDIAVQNSLWVVNSRKSFPCRMSIYKLNDQRIPAVIVSNKSYADATFDGTYVRHCSASYAVDGDTWYPADYVDVGGTPFDTGVAPSDRIMVELRFSGGGSGCLVGSRVSGAVSPSVGLRNDVNRYRVTVDVCGASNYASNFTTASTSGEQSTAPYTVAKLDLRPFTSYASLRNNATTSKWTVVNVNHTKPGQAIPQGMGTMYVGGCHSYVNGSADEFRFSEVTDIHVFDVAVRRDNVVVKRFVPVVKLGVDPADDIYALLDVSDPSKPVLERTASFRNLRRTGGLFWKFGITDIYQGKRPEK